MCKYNEEASSVKKKQTNILVFSHNNIHCIVIIFVSLWNEDGSIVWIQGRAYYLFTQTTEGSSHQRPWREHTAQQDERAIDY